jgi:hypothetical protein
MNHLSLRLLAPALFACVPLVTVACGGAGGGEDVGSSESDLSSNDKTAFDFFVGKGLTDVQAAGIVGNLDQESSMDPSIAQYGGGPGRGIAQWSTGGRWDTSHDDNVVWYAGQHGQSRYSLMLQLEFIWYELPSYGLSELRAATSVTAAVTAFQDRYEICGECDSTNRIAYAESALRAYGHGSGGGSSGGSSGGKGCYSDTLGREMPDNACVQSKYDDAWYQCANGTWDDRWTDPAACDGVYPL